MSEFFFKAFQENENEQPIVQDDLKLEDMTGENIDGTMPDISIGGEPQSMMVLENTHEENFLPEQSTGDEIKLIRPVALIEDFIKPGSE